MKILIIIHNQVATGPYAKILEECEVFVSMGHDVTLLCTSADSRTFLKRRSINGVTILESPDLLWGKLRQGIDIWNLVSRIYAITSIDVDVVHGIDCRPVVIFPALYLKKIKRIPFVLSWWDLFGRGATALERSGRLYNSTFGIVESFFESHFRKYADWATVVSSLLFRRLGELGYNESRIELIRVGGNRYACNHDEIDSLRRSLTGSHTRKILCYVGTLLEHDKDLLVESLRLLKKKVMEMPITILIGQHSFDQSLCKELSLYCPGRLKTREQVHSYIMVSDFCLVPFRDSLANNARWASKMSDYFSNGKPVLGTPIGDLPEIFSRFRFGLLSKSDMPEHYAEILCGAIQAEKDEIDSMKQASLEFFDEELDWRCLANRTVRIYGELLS